MNVGEDKELNEIIRGIDVLTDVDRFKQSMGKLISKLVFLLFKKIKYLLEDDSTQIYFFS